MGTLLTDMKDIKPFFKKMGQTRPLFDYFHAFHMTNKAQLL